MTPLIMEYEEAFFNRAQRYNYAVEKYKYVLDNEFKIAIDVLDLQFNDVLVNIPSGGIPLHKYIDKTLKVTYHGFEPLKDTSCSFTAIPLDDKSVDKIMCLSSFHHVQDQRVDTVNEFKRILKDGGTLVIGDVIKGSLQDEWLNTFVHRYNSNGHIGDFLKPSDVTFMSQYGFEVEVSNQSYNWMFKSDKDAIDFMINLFGLDLIHDTDFLLQSMKSMLNYRNCIIEWQLQYLKCKKQPLVP